MRPGRRLLLLLFWGVCAVAAIATHTTAQAQESAWNTQQWTVEDGLPVNGVTDVQFGPSGFLYLTTFDGIVRFNGRVFETFSVTSHPELPSNRFNQFIGAGPDELLATTEQQELVVLRSDSIAVFRVGSALPGRVTSPDALYIPAQDAFLFGTFGGLVRLDRATLSVRILTPTIPNVRFVGSSQQHGVLFGTEDALYRLEDDRPVRLFAFPNEDGTFHAITEDGDGRLWSRSATEVLVTAGSGGWERVGIPSADIQSEAASARGDFLHHGVDALGRFWLFTTQGALRAVGTGLQPAGPDDWPDQPARLGQCSSNPVPVMSGDKTGPFLGVATCYDARFDRVLGFVQDASGYLWSETWDQGLIKVSQTPVSMVPDTEGTSTYSVLSEPSGRMWTGSLTDRVRCLGPDCPVAPAYTTGTLALHLDRDGTVWGGGIRLLWRYGPSGFERIPLPYDDSGYTRALHVDGQGRVWAGTEVGLVMATERGGTWTFQRFWPELPHPWVRTIRETANGELWIGTNGGGFARIPDISARDVTFDVLSTANGLCSNNPRDIMEDATGSLWVATEDRGLCHISFPDSSRSLDAARTGTIRASDGLYVDGIHNMLLDAFGRLWMGTNTGLFWVDFQALRRVAAGGTDPVISHLYDEQHGLLNRELNGGVQPSAWRSNDGTLFFASQGGIIRVNAADVRSPAPPIVFIRDAIVNDDHRPVRDLRLSPDERDLSIAFSSIYFGDHDTINYQYRLLGYRSDWQSNQRAEVVTYTNLPPGSYRFEVRASVEDVLTDAATFSFTRQAQVWETMPFRIILVLAIILALALSVRRRFQRAALREKELERSVATATADLQRANERLVKAHEAKDQFVANISHELRTPLTLTFGPIADLLSGRYDVAEEARPLLQMSQRNGMRLLRLINQLLDLARFDHGNPELTLAPADLVSFVRQRAAAFESLAAERRIDFTITSTAPNVVVRFDLAAFETVLLNLLSNAFKFTPPGGRISVEVEQTVQHAFIAVRDSGEGIPEEHLPRLFDRFYQVDGSATRRREGSGIGLALSHQIVDHHGGSIHVESTLGQGSVFTVRLERTTEPVAKTVADPVAQDPNQAVNAEAHFPVFPSTPAPSTDGPAGVDILVVEDNPDMSAYIRNELAGVARILQASDGEEGIELAFDEIPDLVISDVMMPIKDGYDVLQALKADTRTSHIPVILLTARADAESRLQGFELGADHFLAKPFDGNDLRARVTSLLANRRLLQEKWSRVVATLSPTDIQADSTETLFLEDVKRHIDANLGNPEFRASELADAMYLSPRQFRRKLSSLINETPDQLIRRFRLEFAASLLEQRAGSVKEVATRSGFGSTSRFTAAFREHYGVPPSGYAGST